MLDNETWKESTYPRIDIKLTGVNLKLLCKAYQIKVKDVKCYLNLASVQSVYDWFYGKTLPSVDYLIALSYLFRLPIEELLVVNNVDCGDVKKDIYKQRKRRILFYYSKF